MKALINGLECFITGGNFYQDQGQPHAEIVVHLVGEYANVMQRAMLDDQNIDMNQVWLFNDQGADNPVKITTKEILDSYFEHWKGKMEKVGRGHMVTQRRCLEDWIVINWAWPKL